jgi:hypothetical protein
VRSRWGSVADGHQPPGRAFGFDRGGPMTSAEEIGGALAPSATADTEPADGVDVLTRPPFGPVF